MHVVCACATCRLPVGVHSCVCTFKRCKSSCMWCVAHQIVGGRVSCVCCLIRCEVMTGTVRQKVVEIQTLQVRVGMLVCGCVRSGYVGMWVCL